MGTGITLPQTARRPKYDNAHEQATHALNAVEGCEDGPPCPAELWQGMMKGHGNGLEVMSRWNFRRSRFV